MLKNFILTLLVLILSSCGSFSTATIPQAVSKRPPPTEILVPTSTPDVSARGMWLPRTSMLTPRSEMPAVELNGLIYVVGGFGPVIGGSANGKDSVSTFEAYDPKNDKWTTLAPAPEERDHSMMAVFQGRIYVFGGYAGEWVVHDNAWMYDPAANQWTTLHTMPASRTSGAAVTVGDFIYLVGGITSTAHVILPTWRYDPANDVWKAVAPLIQPREHVSAVALNGLIYAIGGRWISTLNSIEIYDPAKDEWTPGIPMKDKRAGFGATILNGKIYVAGGELIEVLKTVKSSEVFDPISQTWSALPNLPGGLHGVPLIGLDDALYLIGGSSRSADMINWGRVYSYRP